jgi:hypothetical protein
METGTPLCAASRARTMSPPTVAEGTSTLIDSLIHRIKKSFRMGSRLSFGKSSPQAIESKKIGVTR